jgi:hypothetical protein
MAAALGLAAGVACADGAAVGAHGSARIDGTGAGLNAGAGSGISSHAGALDARSKPPTLGEAPNDTRVLGSGRRMQGDVVPDNLPGTMDPGNATVGIDGTGMGIDGTGALDGSVPRDDADVVRELREGVQR